MELLPCTHSCFVCGESNPIGLQLRFYTDGRVVRTEFVARPEHIGFMRVVHGGIIATLLDEVMAWACAVGTNQFGFCADLQVRYKTPLRPGQRATLTGELAANRRDRIFEARSELRGPADELIASGTGKYMPLRPEEVAEFMGDLIGGADRFRHPVKPSASS